MRLKLTCADVAYSELWKAADGRGKTCRVEKAALNALLQDHARALAVVEQLGIETEVNTSSVLEEKRAAARSIVERMSEDPARQVLEGV